MFRTHMAGVVESLIGVLQTYANAIEGTSQNWHSPQLTPVTRKGVSRSGVETESPAAGSYRTARASQMGVIRKVFSTLGPSESLAVVELSRPAFVKQQNRFKARLKKLVKMNAVSQEDVNAIIRLDNQIISDCLTGEDTDKHTTDQFDNLYADMLEKLKAISVNKASSEEYYEVPDYLMEHRELVYDLYQKIVKISGGDPSKIELDDGNVVRVVGGMDIEHDRDQASTPYNWKKKGRSRKG